MKICSIELKSATAPLMRTEILYSVASSRANEKELVEFTYLPDGKSEKNVIKVIKELRELYSKNHVYRCFQLKNCSLFT